MNIKAPLWILLFVLASFSLVSCFDDRDDNPIATSSINDFVWKAMNFTYLYKSEVPDLADDRFTNNIEYSEFLNSFSSPEDIFESLLFQRGIVDRFSNIVPDFIDLEQRLSGIFVTNGMEFAFWGAPNSNTELVGVVRQVLPGSDADIKGVKRGDLFNSINGTIITRDNAGPLIRPDIYTINLGMFDDKGTPETTDDSIEPTGIDITLEKGQFTENPIFINSVLQVGGDNVGYLMYNGFTSGSEVALNNVFADFKTNNIQHLVLDLRYNPGGSVPTMVLLASMITGQFTGQTFQKLIYNENLQNLNTDFPFQNSISNNGSLNSLGLQKIYVLTTGSSASASEGLINGLIPYIDVVQIGTNTVGKTQASRIFYDSPDFGRQGANPAHRYAVQPLIANGFNTNDVSVPNDGLPPTLGFEYEERPLNLGVLGNPDEPMLAIALADITNSTSKRASIKSKPQMLKKTDMDSYDFLPFEKGGMIAD